MVDKSQKIGFLFPGQGAQFVGMGKDLYDAFPTAKKVFDQADQILGFSITEICFKGPEEELIRTRAAQPGIYTVSIAALEVFKEKFGDLKPSFAAGLSLGEFTALVAAGSLSFESGLKLVKQRSEAMERAARNQPGTMASVIGLSKEICETVSKEAGCSIANLNAPDQIVLSGTRESIEKACSLAEAQGAKRAIPLKVGGAFHSPLMSEARKDLEEALKNASITSPQCTFVPNALARKITDPVKISELLALQLTQSVRWVETMQCAHEEGILQFLEVGPGKVLKGLAKRISKDFTVEACGSVSDFDKLEKELIGA